MQKSPSKMQELLKVPESYRDPNWENSFFAAFCESRVHLRGDQPVNGPDGMAYMLVDTTEDADGEPVGNLLQWLNDKGVGLVVNPKDPYPDYVFSWGMIWNFHKTGLFISTVDQSPKGEFQIEKGQEIHTSEPSEEFLPQTVRSVIRDFWNQQGVAEPRVMEMFVPGQVQGDFCLSLESLGSPKTEEHNGICEVMSWFLPAHYSIVLISEKDFPAFTPL